MTTETEDRTAEDDAVHRLKAIDPNDLPLPEDVIEPDLADKKYEMGATLQDLKVSAASNGANYDITFEVSWENVGILTGIAKGGHDVTWKQVGVGAGGIIRRLTVTKDADDGVHLKLAMRFPQSEVRSVGRLAAAIATHGKLVLEPMQGTLNLPDGTKVDLTAKA